MRYGLLNGDFDRVARQQNFLRAVLHKTLSGGTVGNPVKFTRTLEAVVHNLTVDESWTNGELRSLALDMRGLETRDVRFVTLPFERYANDPTLGSVNIIDEQRAEELWTAMRRDEIGAYLEKYPEDELPEPRRVS